MTKEEFKAMLVADIKGQLLVPESLGLRTLLYGMLAVIEDTSVIDNIESCYEFLKIKKEEILAAKHWASEFEDIEAEICLESLSDIISNYVVLFEINEVLA